MQALSANELLSGVSLKRGADTARILVAGDLCSAGRAEPLLLDWKNSRIWEDIAEEVGSHDLRVVNLESPLTRLGTAIVKSGPHLSANPICAGAIRGANFDVVTLANNHVMDMGPVGLKETIDACRSVGLRTVGAGVNLADAAQPLYIKVKGLSVGILAITEHEDSIATGQRAGAWPLDPIDNFRQIQKARRESDFVLVVLHGGNERYSLPSPRMKQTCRFFVDAGADAVVCHHIHVPSGVEIYRDAPIVYSTGNFLFDETGPVTRGWHSGYLASISAGQSGATSLRLIPYWQCVDGINIRFMDENESGSFLGGIHRLSETIADEEALLFEWRRFCASVKKDYVCQILGLSRVERGLYKIGGIWPFWRMKQRHIPRLLNMFECEAQRDVCIETLASGRVE